MSFKICTTVHIKSPNPHIPDKEVRLCRYLPVKLLNLDDLLEEQAYTVDGVVPDWWTDLCVASVMDDLANRLSPGVQRALKPAIGSALTSISAKMPRGFEYQKVESRDKVLHNVAT